MAEVLKAIRAKTASDKQSTVRVERRVADLLRQIQTIAGYRTPSELLDAMLVSFVRHELQQIVEPEFETPEEEVRRRRASQAAKDNRRNELIAAGQRIDTGSGSEPEERRKAERRTKKGSAALYPADQERRKGIERRKG